MSTALPSSQTEEPALTDVDFRDQAAFRAAVRRFLRVSEEQARRHGVTPQQHLVLLVVRGHPRYPHVSVGNVAEALQLRHHSASLLVDRGVDRGLLVRTRDENDRRRVQIALTVQGQDVLAAITLANREQLHTLKSQFLREQLWENIVGYDDAS